MKKDWILREHNKFSDAIKELFAIDEEEVLNEIKEANAATTYVIMAETKTEAGYNLLTKVLGLREEDFENNYKLFIRGCEVASIIKCLYHILLKEKNIQNLFVPIPAIINAATGSEEKDVPMFM